MRGNPSEGKKKENRKIDEIRKTILLDTNIRYIRLACQ